MEQLVLLLVIAAISLINWLIERSAKLREQRRLQKEAEKNGNPPPSPVSPLPEPSARQELEEQMRRVMESFGIPVDLPEPARERPAPAIVVEVPATPPPLPSPAPPAATPRPSLRRAKKTPVAFQARSPWVARLGSPNGLREAVVLREILGPPKALSEL